MIWLVYEKSTHVVVNFFLIWVVYERVLMSLSNFALKRVSVCSFTKSVFNLVKDLCKLIEGWSRSVSILVGSESKGIFDLGGLGKKYSCRQILRSKECRCAVSRKVSFNLVMDLCKLNEGWSRSVSILVGSESARIFDLDGLRKKYSCRSHFFLIWVVYEKVLMSLSNFALKRVSVCSFTKSVFQSGHGLVQIE